MKSTWWHFTAPHTGLDLFCRWRSQAAAEYRGACALMQTHTYLLKSPAWVEDPLTECTSRKPFSDTGPNKPVLLVSLISLTQELHPLSSLSFKCQSHDAESKRVCHRVHAPLCACAHKVECDTFCPTNDGNQQAITAHAAAVVLHVSRWPPNRSLKFLYNRKGVSFYHWRNVCSAFGPLFGLNHLFISATHSLYVFAFQAFRAISAYRPFLVLI